MAGKFKRSGLHRLECPQCVGYCYSTVSQLEMVGFPACACGETMMPERLELALMLGVDSPIVAEYQRRTERKLRGQMPASRRPCQVSESLADMGAKAALEIQREQRYEARQRRIRAILPVPEALPF